MDPSLHTQIPSIVSTIFLVKDSNPNQMKPGNIYSVCVSGCVSELKKIQDLDPYMEVSIVMGVPLVIIHL